MIKISNYEELVQEQRRLENEISVQKLRIRYDLHELKEKMNPFMSLLPVLAGLRDTPVTSVLQSVTKLGIDVVGGAMLAKSNWLTRLVVPKVLKFISSRSFGKKAATPVTE
jgi:hypothetical protein